MATGNPSPTTKELSIAVLGWGSLVWDPRELAITSAGWGNDGPSLPIEFLRVSGIRRSGKEISERDTKRYLSLVIAEGAEDIVTLWAMSGLRDLESARLNLKIREGAHSIDSIGYVNADAEHIAAFRGSGGAEGETDRLVQRLRTWMSERHLDAVIWTDLRTNYLTETGDEPTPDNVLAFLSTKLKPEERERAENYIRRAPRQIATALRQESRSDLAG